MSHALTAVCDANVLYPAPLRDLLMRLAQVELFRARWTDRIHDEWKRNLLAKSPGLTQEKLDRVSRLMDDAILDASVTGYEDLIEGLSLPDPDDRHVLAAAIRGEAGVIITFNLRDFPGDRLAPLGIEAQHPDEFISGLAGMDVAKVVQAVRLQRAALKNPPVDADQLLDVLRRQGLARTTALLSDFRSVL